jgi:hypothetical protein
MNPWIIQESADLKTSTLIWQHPPLCPSSHVPVTKFDGYCFILCGLIPNIHNFLWLLKLKIHYLCKIPDLKKMSRIMVLHI